MEVKLYNGFVKILSKKYSFDFAQLTCGDG